MDKKFRIFKREVENTGFSTEKESDPKLEFQTDCKEEAVENFENLKKEYSKEGYTVNPKEYEFTDYYSLTKKRAVQLVFELMEFDDDDEFVDGKNNKIFSVANFYIHPLENLLLEYNMTRYQLSKHGVPESTSSSIVNRKTKVDDISIGIVVKLANALELDIDGVYARLKDYEMSI